MYVRMCSFVQEDTAPADISDNESVHSITEEGDFDIGNDEADLLKKSRFYPQSPTTVKKTELPPSLQGLSTTYDPMITAGGYDVEPKGTCIRMNNLKHHFSTCYIYSRVKGL